jgi:hypothetical protein
LGQNQSSRSRGTAGERTVSLGRLRAPAPVVRVVRRRAGLIAR